jgi:mycofactocin precursor
MRRTVVARESERCTLQDMESPIVTADTSVIEESPVAHVVGDDPAIEAELLIEEISIDGMCGVY